MSTTSIEGIPEDLARIDLDEKRAIVDIDAGLYPVEALYGAAYVFIDRCYVFLDRPEPTRLRVVIAPKQPPEDPEATLRELVGELANELVSAAWRHQITQENRAQIEAVTMQAISGAMGPPSLDDLEDFDFSEEAFEDPLGIAMSWEEKYAKKKEDAPDAESADTAEETASDEASADGASADEASADGASADGAEGDAQ